MRFYIRKSVSVGPFRFNLSGSGVGMSVGVKGLRVGAGPRGNYVHMGRGGLYYRASLNGRRTGQPSTSPVDSVPHLAPAAPQTIETGDLVEMVPSNGSKVVEEINEKLALLRRWPWVFGLGLIPAVVLAHQSQTNAVVGTLLLTALLSAIVTYWDRQRKAVVVLYDLEGNSRQAFEMLGKAFERVGAAQCIWNIDTDRTTDDWKRNAGASHIVSRKVTQLTNKAPSVVKTNISIPAISGGRRSVFFMPDVVLVLDGQRVGAIAYDELKIRWSDSIFLETGRVPRDAHVVGYSWQYVNRSGGPDRRFKNNRQVPRVMYQEMSLEGSGGFRKILQISQHADRSDFDGAIRELRAAVRELKRLELR